MKYDWKSASFLSRSAAFQNNVFTSNFVRGWGSAVWSLSAYDGDLSPDGTFDWSNCTFVGNAVIDQPLCGFPGPIVAHGTGTVFMDGSGTMNNSIFWDNHGVADVALPHTRDGVKPLGAGRWPHSHCNIEVYSPGSLPGMRGNISVIPRFVDPAVHNYNLRADSPCLDVGSQDLVLLEYPNGNGTGTLGQVAYEFNLHLPRSVDVVPAQSCAPSPNVCGEVDMGAFERQSAP